MKKKLNILFFLVFFLLYISNENNFFHFNDFLLSFENYDEKNINNQFKDDFNKDLKTKYGLFENISVMDVNFCPKDDCFSFFINGFKYGKNSIYCAFYDLDLINLTEEIININNSGVDFQIIVDDNYLDEKPIKILKNNGIKVYSDLNRKTRYNNYMHNKFCVIDQEYVITGSANPTERGFYKNNNNLIFLESNFLAKNYYNEFNQMRSGIFGYNKENSLEFNNISLNYNGDIYFVENYFCPQNNCEEKILNKLNLARDSIFFASFVLTSDNIENTLINLSKKGLNVEGVVEKRNSNSKSSEISKLNQSFRVYFDKNSYTMHHKFFIIDKEWVIFGSMNPSKSGNLYNDENILIIKNKNLANKFYQEYLDLLS
jgi:phosphatidylserine/phosphatidylglycerophosphate/cardiolipin synthase-like enzyme